ncbi:hypothetical protein BGZ58_005269, partial [Dissophora ornata]
MSWRDTHGTKRWLQHGKSILTQELVKKLTGGGRAQSSTGKSMPSPFVPTLAESERVGQKHFRDSLDNEHSVLPKYPRTGGDSSRIQTRFSNSFLDDNNDSYYNDDNLSQRNDEDGENDKNDEDDKDYEDAEDSVNLVQCNLPARSTCSYKVAAASAIRKPFIPGPKRTPQSSLSSKLSPRIGAPSAAFVKFGKTGASSTVQRKSAQAVHHTDLTTSASA